MTTLYFLANSLDYLVAGTGNRSELAIGYFTKHGDGGCDLLPIGHLLKSEVRALARELNVPSAIIERTPSAGLWLGQSDEEEMGFTYAELERYLDEGPQGVSPALAMKIERLIRVDRAQACSCRRCRTPNKKKPRRTRRSPRNILLCDLGDFAFSSLHIGELVADAPDREQEPRVRGSASMRRRSRLTSVSTLRTVTKVSPRQILASSASRLNTMPACVASRCSRRNS